MAKEKRFVKTYSEDSFAQSTGIVVDRQTGVQYLVFKSGYGAGITPLLDREGKPLFTSSYTGTESERG